MRYFVCIYEFTARCVTIFSVILSMFSIFRMSCVHTIFVFFYFVPIFHTPSFIVFTAICVGSVIRGHDLPFEQ